MRGKLACIILPLYNEAASFSLLREMFDSGLEITPEIDYLIIVVDDGSTDITPCLAWQWAIENAAVIVLTHPENRGLGAALMTGFRAAVALGADYLVTLDGDATHPAAKIGELLAAVSGEADIAIASRFTKTSRTAGVPLYRRFCSIGASFVFQCVFPLRGVRDYTTGFRAYRAAVVREMLARHPTPVFRSFAVSVEILLYSAAFAGLITEVPLVLRYDLKRSPSKMNVLSTVRDCLRLCLLPKATCKLGRGLRG
ncbi:MAG: glycosyltransferase family 2 protein [bacterium]